MIEHVNQTIMAFFMMEQRFKREILLEITVHILTWKV